MIDSRTVPTSRGAGVDVGPVVTLPSDVASGPAVTDRARLLAALDGLDPTGSVSVGWLVRLLRQFGGDPTVELTFDGTTASLPQKAMTLRAVALRCGRSPGTVGTWQQTWRRLGLVRAGPPTAVNVARLCEECSEERTAGPALERVVPAAVEPTRAPRGADGEKLDILLRHLRLAAAAGEGAVVDVITDLAQRLVAPTAREIAQSSGVQTSVRELESLLDSSSLPSSGARDARSIARSDGSGGGRSTAATLALLGPLLGTVDRLGLAPLTDGEKLARALRPYSDAQVLQAQSVLLRQCDTQRNVTSPIGLLVRRAQQGAPEYFELPAPEPVVETRLPEDRGPALGPEEQAAALARARGELAQATGQRRPVHRAGLHTAA